LLNLQVQQEAKESIASLTAATL